MQDDGKRVERLKQMLLSRHVDEKVNDLHAEGKVHGTAHFYVGRESVAVGAIAAKGATGSLSGPRSRTPKPPGTRSWA